MGGGNQGSILALVVSVIKECPEAANDDVILLERVWKAEGWDDRMSLFDNLCRVSNPESITRRRAFLSEREPTKQPPKAVSWLDD
jgi:hypothetical protein